MTRFRWIASTRQFDAVEPLSVSQRVRATGRKRPRTTIVRVGNETTDQDSSVCALDHNLNSNQRIFGRYEYLRDDSRPVTPLPDGSGSITTGVIGDTLTRADSVAAGTQLDAVREQGESASVRIYAAWLQSGIAANRPAGIAGIGHSEHSGVRLFGHLPTYDVVGFSSWVRRRTAMRISRLGDAVRGQLLVAARPSQLEDGRRLAHRAPQYPAAAQSNGFLPVHEHSDQQPVGNRNAGDWNGQRFASFLLGQVQTFHHRRAARSAEAARADR